MNRRRIVAFAMPLAMLLEASASNYDPEKNPRFLLEMKIEQSVQDDFKPPAIGFMYRYDGNPIYEHANEYLIIGDGKIHYVSYDPELFNQISALVEGGNSDESDIKKKLKKTEIVGDFKACPKIDATLTTLYRDTIKHIESENFPEAPGIKIGGSFEYKLYFSNWKGNRFTYEFEDRTSELNEQVHHLVDYLRGCGTSASS